jgi:hypothetical protein
MFASLLASTRRGMKSIALVTTAALVGCSVFGESVRIQGYRVADKDTINVLATTADGWETWVASVQETETRVVVEVRTRRPQGAGVFPGQDLWLTIDLEEPLGDRSVTDASTNFGVSLVAD